VTWLKVDDSFYDHPRVEEVPLSALGLWVRCGAYTSRWLNDGYLKQRIVRRLDGRTRDVAALVDAGLWLPVTGSEFQFVMHDFHQWNPTAEQVRARRNHDRIRQEEWRASRHLSRRD